MAQPRLLAVQIERQKTKKHEYLFSASTGNPRDMNLFRNRKMVPMLSSLKIEQGGVLGFPSVQRFPTQCLRVPLNTIQERLGHALSGSLTLDVYTYAELPENVGAAKLAGDQIEKAVNSVSLTANKEKGLLAGASEALAA